MNSSLQSAVARNIIAIQVDTRLNACKAYKSITMPPKKKKVQPKFSKEHCLEYGLKIIARDAATLVIADVR